MDVTVMLQAITTVGFPIAMCLVLMWYVMKSNEAHKEEIKDFTDALNKNTLVLQKLCDRLDIEMEEKNEQ